MAAEAAAAAAAGATQGLQAAPPAAFALISATLTTIVLVTFVGNLFVIVAIKVDKNLQTTANQLVLSLASADLMVACLVMPLGAYNDLGQGWYLGTRVCEFWTSADVLCCTASILNLLAIAVDRYWAVTNADYIYRRTRRRVNLMILCAWTVGAVVSLAPIFGWKDPDFQYRVLVEHKCLVSQDVAYQIFATLSTFYLPLVLLLALYWRIFQVARKRIHRRPGAGLEPRARMAPAAPPPGEPGRPSDKTGAATNSSSPGGRARPRPARGVQLGAGSGGQEAGRQKVDHLDKSDGSDAAAADEASSERGGGGGEGAGLAAKLGRRQRVRPLAERSNELGGRDEDCCCCCRAAATCQVCRQAAGEINRAGAPKSRTSARPANQAAGWRAPDKRPPDIDRRPQSPTGSCDSSVATSSTSGPNHGAPAPLAWPHQSQISVDIDDLNAADDDDDELDDEESLSSAFPPPLVAEGGGDGLCAKPNRLQLKLVAALHPAEPPAGLEPETSPRAGLHTKRLSRSLDLRRKFKALGQLVSFVQTSGPSHYTTSGSTSSASSPLSVTSSDRRRIEAPRAPPASDLSLAALASPAQVAAETGVQQAAAGGRAGEGPMATAPNQAARTTAAAAAPAVAAAANSSRGASGSTGAGSGPGSRGAKALANLKTTTTKAQLEVRREKKAAKTLAIITGVFVCCWLPFFLNAIIMPICGPSCTPSDLVLSILLWLGYLNSLLNPIIYTIFSPDFRRAFRRLLCWRRRRPSAAKRS